MRDYCAEKENAFFAIFQDYLDLERNTHRRLTPAEYTLARMEPLAELAGHPERRLKVVHVAGTKGKGTTCYYLAALLRAAGLRCGTFTSPHLVTVRERFQIAGDLIGYDQLLESAADFDRRVRAANAKPTFFEAMTVYALERFVAAGCELAILEAGIGGLLDSTNYVPDPVCCVITPVSFDHMEILGHTIAEIAAQKAGIIKPGRPVVCARQPYAEAEAVIRRTAQLAGAALYPAPPCAEPERWGIAGLPAFLRENFAVALAVCRILGVRPAPRRFHLPETRGRCEVLRRDPLVLIDAAHNADSARRLVEAVHERFPGRHFTVVLGIVEGKDAAGIVAEMKALDARFILTHPRSTMKASGLAGLTQACQAAGLRFEVIERLDGPAQLPASDNLLFTGSFYTALIGEALFNP